MTTSTTRSQRELRSPTHTLRGLRIATILVLAVGVVCQFVQDTDPKFPLLYFTIDSAILLAFTLTLALLRPTLRWVDSVRGTATVAVVLSGLIFATVISPATGTGTWFQPHDDMWIRTANVLLHGIGPVLAVADFLTSPQRSDKGVAATALQWCLWPLAYLAAILPLHLSGIVTIPYTFLDVSAAGALPALGAMTGLFILTMGLGAILKALHGLINRKRAGTRLMPA